MKWPWVRARVALIPALLLAAACGKDGASPSSAPTGGAVADLPAGEERPPLACLVPMASEKPREVFAVESCPPDVDGRPTMPEGAVEFVDAPQKPRLRVEHAVNDEHRAHGLMFRDSLSDDEGMLFSWSREERRAFWMRNTCLALDMLFLNADGRILGVLEQVPPMNEATRTIPCPAAHVLEVRAGWTREHGVEPGQLVRLDLTASPR